MRELFSRVVYTISTLSAYYSFNNMSKRRYSRFRLFIGIWLAGAACLCWPQSVTAQSNTSPAGLSSSGTLANSQLQRARSELEQTERLVSDGTLPRVKLEEARGRLSDAEDEALLSRTLFGFRPAGSMTEEEANGMVAAALRRVDRARTVVEERQTLLASGAIARVDVENATRELEERERTLGFAQDRLRLLKELSAMAESERQLEKSSESASFKNAVIRSDGNGSFSLSDLTPIQAQFEKRFNRPLPISALGQTLTHQSLGLDHKNRVDVALSPTQVEGTWLLQLLARLHVPYLAFRTAVPGAATAPHIHIGLGSTRLQAVFGSPGTHAAYSLHVR
ncbi:MAG: hypothetical protein ACJ74Y_16145 [Bryobacteraceae bacterium]